MAGAARRGRLQGMQLGPPPPPGYAPYPYAGEPPSSGSHTGLLIALIAAVIAALGAVAAVVILASSGGSSGPTISTATNAAVQTVPTTPSTGGSNTRHARPHHRTQRVIPVPPPVRPTSTTAPPPPSASPADAAAARATVFNHWTLIGEGNYEAAYALFVSGYQNQSTWIADKNTDRPVVSNLVVGSADMHSATSATVPLVSLNTVGQQAPQCHNWTGSYDLTKVGGSWLISQANLNGTTC